MESKIYELLIFQDQQLIFYYDPLNTINQPNYQQLRQSHRIQNLMGVSKTLNVIIKQIYPSQKTMFRNFKTKQYQFNQYDAVNGLKIIAITSIRSDDKAQESLQQIYQAYLNYVKKNYLFRVGDIIDVKPFHEEVARLLKNISDK